MVVKLNQEHVTVTGYHGHLFVLRQREKSQYNGVPPATSGWPKWFCMEGKLCRCRCTIILLHLMQKTFTVLSMSSVINDKFC